jgi:Protein of unknown function (DUF1629)
MDLDLRVRGRACYKLENESFLLNGQRLLSPPTGQRGFPEYPEPPRFLFDKRLGGHFPRDLELCHSYWLISDRMKTVLQSVDREGFAFVQCEVRLACNSESVFPLQSGQIRAGRNPNMKTAKSRSWTDADVQETIAEIKKKAGLWEELERIEATTGEFRDVDAGLEQTRVVIGFHPKCELNEITDLLLAIRLVRRATLGLK